MSPHGTVTPVTGGSAVLVLGWICLLQHHHRKLGDVHPRLQPRAELGRKPGLLIGCISRRCRYPTNRSNTEKCTATSLMHVTGETLSMKSQGNPPNSTHSSRNAPRHPEALGRTCWGSLGHPRTPQTGSEPRDPRH